MLLEGWVLYSLANTRAHYFDVADHFWLLMRACLRYLSFSGLELSLLAEQLERLNSNKDQVVLVAYGKLGGWKRT